MNFISMNRSSLEQSCQELQNTAAELEKRLKMIDEESKSNFIETFSSSFAYLNI